MKTANVIAWLVGGALVAAACATAETSTCTDGACDGGVAPNDATTNPDGSTPKSDGSTTDAGGCGNGTVACPSDGGTACVTTSTDDDNCGTCGVKCSTGEICQGGKCTLTCDAGLSLCAPDGGSQYCANFTSDNDNCGACGDVCDAGQCQSSQCVVTVTAVEIFPPSGTNEDPGNASTWSGRYYTVTFAQTQTLAGVEWRANLATADSMYAEIWDPNTQTSLAKGTSVNGSSVEQFYKSPISYTAQANTAYLIGIYMSNVNTVFPRKDSPSYPFSVTGPHGNITVSACYSTYTTPGDVFPSASNSWGPDFKFDIE